MTEVLHRRDNPYQLPPPWGISCQNDYLRRCSVWERGMVAVPYKIPVSHPLNESPTTAVFFDTETYFMPEDIGYYAYQRVFSLDREDREMYIPKMRLGLSVTIDNEGQVRCWDECQARQLSDYLDDFDKVVSFNGLDFDYYILSAYTSPDRISSIKTKSFDLHQYLEQKMGKRRSLNQWSRQYLGLSNSSKYLLASGFGYEEGRLVQGFARYNTIPFILREGSAAQKVIAWTACFEDTLNTLLIYEELLYEEQNELLKKEQDTPTRPK